MSSGLLVRHVRASKVPGRPRDDPVERQGYGFNSNASMKFRVNGSAFDADG
jgi:hypothetical protein